ncbi:hypothetical protein V8G54_013270 [Vigna mungo]|uniref:S-protein homolog n=1 Tax=Vigna mungo TaxID=3915 RepID=A0AAQ3NTE3_VIGMU
MLFPPDKVVVSIYNVITWKNLTVHCKDKHHDLGTHVLQYGGNYKFSFKPNFFARVTLYFCRFSWEGGSHSFDIYDEDRDDCSLCVWNVLESGPCMHYAKYDECFAWKH